MPNVTKTYTFSAGAVIIAAQHNTDFDTLYNLVNGALDGTNLVSNAAIVDTQLGQITTAGKVSGAALTSLSSIPGGAGVIPVANLPSASYPLNYRAEFTILQASSTTMTVLAGQLEINGTSISKTAPTTLTLTTAGDWAGGASLQAVSTYGYVGVDTSGNIKMHTTAPTHINYGVSITTGKKRYATWSSTVYRIIGWFYMNSTGSGELNAWEVANFKDPGIENFVSRIGTTNDTVNDTTFGNDMTETTFHYYNSGEPIQITFDLQQNNGGNSGATTTEINFDSSADTSSDMVLPSVANTSDGTSCWVYQKTLSQGTHTIQIQLKVFQNSTTTTKKITLIKEL